MIFTWQTFRVFGAERSSHFTSYRVLVADMMGVGEHFSLPACPGWISNLSENVNFIARALVWLKGKVESSLEADSYPNRVCCRCRNGWCCWFFKCTYNPHLINNVSSVSNAPPTTANDLILPPVGWFVGSVMKNRKLNSSLSAQSFYISWPNSNMSKTNTRKGGDRRVEVLSRAYLISPGRKKERKLSVCALDGWWEKRIRFDFSVQISCLFRIYLDFLHLQQTIISRN